MAASRSPPFESTASRRPAIISRVHVYTPLNRRNIFRSVGPGGLGCGVGHGHVRWYGHVGRATTLPLLPGPRRSPAATQTSTSVSSPSQALAVGELITVSEAGHWYVIRFDGGHELETVLLAPVFVELAPCPARRAASWRTHPAQRSAHVAVSRKLYQQGTRRWAGRRPRRCIAGVAPVDALTSAT